MDDAPSPIAAGWIGFAGVILIISGCLHSFAGLVGIINDEFYAVTPDYVLKLDATGWGWIHLLVGIVLLASGFGVFSGNVLARTVGVLAACGSVLAAFFWMPWYPLWGIVLIFIGLSVIWALTVHGRDWADMA